MGKFAKVIMVDLTLFEGKEKELEELNKERMRVAGYKSDYARIVVCPHCGKESLEGPKPYVKNVKIANKIPLGWKRKPVNPPDKAVEANPPEEKEIKAKEEMELAQKEFDEARADIGKLLKKFSIIKRRGFDLVPVESILRAARNMRDKKEEAVQKTRSHYNNLYRQRMRRIQQYRENEEKKAMEKLEEAKQAKKNKNWRRRIKEIISM